MSFQMGSAMLDACVLAILSKGDTYGYVLTREIKAAVKISESTLYPVLRRLQKEEFLETYDKAIQGRNRRYYAITENGKIKLQIYQRDWKEFRDAIDKIISGGEIDE